MGTGLGTESTYTHDHAWCRMAEMRGYTGIRVLGGNSRGIRGLVVKTSGEGGTGPVIRPENPVIPIPTLKTYTGKRLRSRIRPGSWRFGAVL